MKIEPHTLPIELHRDELIRICQSFGVQELRLFGSVLRNDFHDQSDIDVLCTLQPDSPARGMRWIDLLLALEDMWGRPVDLVKPKFLNRMIREEVLQEAQTIYVASS
ncbi:MAG: nucleotidyltransferase domain-containing protein [Thermaerobacter sp.]|nr:nucleotidyltransferase domain-containing protein [Thermaerobacter sp.]